MADKIINNVVIDNQPGKFYAPNVLTGLEDTEEISELKSGLSGMQTATASDVGKALKAKTVTDGKVTEWEFGEAGGSIELDAMLTDPTKAAQAKATGDSLKNKLDYVFSYTTNSGTGKYLSTSNVWKEDTRFYYIITDMIPCNEGDVFVYHGGCYVAASVLYYLNGAFVSAVNYVAGTITTVTIPAGVNGVRFQSASMQEVTLSVERLTPKSFKDLESDLESLKNDLSHKADYDFHYTTNSGTGKYLSTSNVWKEDTRFYYIYTDLIPCAAGDIFEYIGRSYVAASVLFYKSGAFVSGVNYTASTEVTIPENVDGVIFQSAWTSEVTLSIKKIFPHTVRDIILGTDVKSGMVWTKTERGAEWSSFSYDDPFVDKIDFATIFDDESLYSMAMEDGIARYSRVEIPAHSIIKKVRFKSSDAGNGYIQIATTEFVSDRYMMNVKVYPVDYVAGWNEIEINFVTENHTEYLLGFSNLKILYGDYTSLSGTIDAKYMFGRGLRYNSNASNAIGSENIRFAFDDSQSGANYKFCVAFDADVYTGDFIKKLDELSQKTLPASINILNYKVIDGSIGYVGRWYDYTENGNTYKVASADGSYICFKVSGATSVTILWGGNFTANSCISYKIDDGEYVRIEVDAAGNTITIPDTNEHIIQIVMDAINVPNSTWWTVGNGIGIKEVNTDGTLKAITPTNKRIIFFGDSLTQGVRALGTESTEMPNGNSAINSYGWYMAKYLNANPILVGYGSSGITINGAFKKCIDAINYVADGKDTEDLDVDLIVINHGHNDASASSENFIAGYNEVLNRFVTKYPATPVLCVTPFNARHAEDVKVCAEAKANCYFVNTYPLYLDRYYADGPGHLLLEGADVCGRYLAQKAVDFGII